jgi:asparagine synthase (glutamine-hydrolysing)
MCGIFGLAGLGRDVTDDDRRLVEDGMERLEHRGPDAGAVARADHTWLGHRRLSIIDLATGDQPMWSADGRSVVAYNGEVYNHLELRRQLEGAGRQFHTHCDTEAVLNAYLEWGADAPAHLRGMFAFAVVDTKRRTLLLARDRLGVKPLYYTVQDGRLVWSSELEPLYRAAGPFRMDVDALDEYLNWQYIHAPRTIYRDVKALRPGCAVEVNLATGVMTGHQYWRLNFSEDRAMSAGDWGARIDDVLRESVKIRLMSDVPFGAFLSGGIDSSLVVGYMADIMDQPVKTFSIGFREADFSELTYADEVARLNRTEHHVEIVEAESLDLLPTLVRHFGQPFADSSAIPTYHVARMARKHVKMVLSGDGGDENFAGYNSYEYIARELGLIGAAAASGSETSRFRALATHFLHKVQGQAPLADDDLDRAYRLHVITAQHFSNEERRRLFNARYQQAVGDRDSERRALMNVPNAPLLSRLQHLDLMAYLPYDILVKVDIASMANSLEAREPLLDHVLVETAATMPSELKLRPLASAGGEPRFEQKHMLRNVAKRRYPAALVDRRKMGFGVPVGEWMRTALRARVEARLLHSPALPNFFDMRFIEQLWTRHVASGDSTAKVWNLLVLDEWLQTHPEAWSSAS